jgi:aryl carrier-like protein
VITQHRAPKPRADASYLITGGLGGLGLACAEWLAREGARHLLLLGRRAPDDTALACIARLRELGVTVQAAQADVSDAAQLGAVLHAMRAEMPPLRGILHAAGAIDDAMLAELGLSRFDPVMAPKVRGTWNLHEQTLADPLDFFVMFSSGAGLLGALGQGNYAAANCFMDGFAAWRRAQGRPALSINWGSWSEVGMASGVGESHHRRWAAMGLQMIEPQQGVQMLQDLLYRAEAPQLAALPLVRSRLPQGLGPFMADLRVVAPSTAASSTAASVDMRRVLQATNAPERAAALSAFLAEQIVKVLALGAGTRVDLQRSLMEMGLDSLMAMELRNRIQSSVGVRVAVGELLRGPSIAELAGIVLQEMGLDATADTPEQIDLEEPAWEEGSL